MFQLFEQDKKKNWLPVLEQDAPVKTDSYEHAQSLAKDISLLYKGTKIGVFLMEGETRKTFMGSHQNFHVEKKEDKSKNFEA